MLYADNGGIVCVYVGGGKTCEDDDAIVTVFEAEQLTMFEKKTETKLQRTLNQVPPTSPLALEAAGPRYMQMMQCVYLGGFIDPNADIIPKIT